MHCSVHFTFYSPTDQFNETSSHLLWEAFSHVAINAQIPTETVRDMFA